MLNLEALANTAEINREFVSRILIPLLDMNTATDEDIPVFVSECVKNAESEYCAYWDNPKVAYAYDKLNNRFALSYSVDMFFKSEEDCRGVIRSIFRDKLNNQIYRLVIPFAVKETIEHDRYGYAIIETETVMTEISDLEFAKI